MLTLAPRCFQLKLQFDDSLTRTFEYPSETSLCEESPSAPPATATLATLATPAMPATLAAPATLATPATVNGELQLSQTTMMAPLAANTHLSEFLRVSTFYIPYNNIPTNYQVNVLVKPAAQCVHMLPITILTLRASENV